MEKLNLCLNLSNRLVCLDSDFAGNLSLDDFVYKGSRVGCR